MRSFKLRPQLAERIWGGQDLPMLRLGIPGKPGVQYGESWEICDRPELDSIVSDGDHAGQSLHSLWSTYREEIFGQGYESLDRFPLLCKILDVHDNLSLQIHPPAQTAARWNGEVKNEIWYIASHSPGATIYMGLKRDFTESEIKGAIRTNRLADMMGAYSLNDGDSVFIPSGLVHGIGAGHVIYEIQQNSDTTYRLYDWGRVDASGHARELHLEQSLDAIREAGNPVCSPRPAAPGVLVDESCFRIVEEHLTNGTVPLNIPASQFAVLVVISGELDYGNDLPARPGDFLIFPAHGEAPVAIGPARPLIATVPPQS